MFGLNLYNLYEVILVFITRIYCKHMKLVLVVKTFDCKQTIFMRLLILLQSKNKIATQVWSVVRTSEKIGSLKSLVAATVVLGADCLHV